MDDYEVQLTRTYDIINQMSFIRIDFCSLKYNRHWWRQKVFNGRTSNTVINNNKYSHCVIKSDL